MTSQHVLVCLNVLRILTCVFVIVLGYKTLRIRQENENRLQNSKNFYGNEAERILPFKGDFTTECVFELLKDKRE